MRPSEYRLLKKLFEEYCQKIDSSKVDRKADINYNRLSVSQALKSKAKK